MGIFKRLRGLFGSGARRYPILELGHIGLTLGAHGRRLEEADAGTRDFVGKLLQACGQSYYFLQRLHIAERPLQLVLVGRDYNISNGDAAGLMRRLVAPEDLVLSAERKDDILTARLKAREVKFNGLTSTHLTSPEDQELYGPYWGSLSQENAYIGRSLLHFARSRGRGRIYQHCCYERAIMTYGRRHCVRGGPEVTTTYDWTLAAAAEKEGLSYAVLLPKRLFVWDFGGGVLEGPDYFHTHAEFFKRSAAMEFALIEKHFAR